MSRNTGRDGEKKRKPMHENHVTAAEMMASGTSDSQIAEVLGMHQSTVTRWRHREDVAAEVTRIQRNAAQGARAKLADAMHSAIASLVKLADSAEDESVRCKAAEVILEKGLPAMGVAPTTTLQFGISQTVSVEDAKTLVRETRKGVVDV